MSLNQALVAKLEAIVGAEYVRTDRGDVDGEFRRSKQASDAMVGVRGLTAGAPLGGHWSATPPGEGGGTECCRRRSDRDPWRLRRP